MSSSVPSILHEVSVACNAVVNENFFLDFITPELIARIRASDYVVYDLETTGLTRWAKPLAMAKGAQIGGESLPRYRKRMAPADVAINVRVRARILSIQLSDSSKLAWDIDKLSPADAAELVEACLDQQIVVGWNLGFDYAFSLGLSKAWRPSLTLDVMLLARCLRPGLFWKVHEVAAKDALAHPEILRSANEKLEDEEDSFGDEAFNGAEEDAFANEVFESFALRIVRKSEASASLDAVSVALGLGKLDKRFQKPANWAVSPLSRGHFDYVMGDVDAPLEILRRMYPRAVAMEDIVNEIVFEDETKGREFQDIFEPAPYELALIHDRGMPVHLPTLDAVQEHRANLVPALVEKLTSADNIPGLAPFKEKLTSARVSTTAEMKKVLGEYAAAHGCVLDTGEDGSPIIQAKSAKLKGAFDLSGWALWDQLQHARKTMASCSEYALLSERDQAHDGYARVHPLISCAASTLRTTSKTPNAQNMERASDKPPKEFLPDLSLEQRRAEWLSLQFRSIIRARPGHKIVLADYGQIELRIAGGLSLRCTEEILAAIRGEDIGRPVAPWILQALTAETAPVPTDDFTMAFDFWTLWNKVKTRGCAMARLFREGVDPHLYTGLQMAVKQGVVSLPIGVTVMQYLKGLTKDQEDALKSQIKTQRTGAKALNFGLLYGMGAESLWVQGIVNYGLSWTMEEAVAARDEWLNELFPEIALWQLWHKQIHRDGKNSKTSLLRRNKWKGNKLEVQQLQMRYGTTLGGRPFVDPDTRLLNYMDQGTGASLAVFAIVNMPSPAREHIISFVHDEIILEVPEHLVAECARQLEQAMVAAGDRFLSTYRIPVEASPEILDVWLKA